MFAANPWPMRREIAVIDGNLGFLDRKYATAAESRYALRAGLELVRGIARNDRFLVIVAVVLNVINSHHLERRLDAVFRMSAKDTFGGVD
jgi:hypothetical protein